jgi:NhaP-type Na+/H+ or K+/H+ antiporter
VKGKFADKNVPKDLQLLIIAESGANDGLGFPFLFFALYIINGKCLNYPQFFFQNASITLIKDSNVWVTLR